MSTFSEIYISKIDEYLDSIDTFLSGGKTFCDNGISIICITKAPLYTIPHDVIEFIQSGTLIIKLHSYTLKKEINIDLKWDELGIRMINGVEHNYNAYRTCDSCNVNILSNEIWYVGTYELCNNCYSAENFGSYKKEEFNRRNNIEVNFLDWIEFMTEPFLDMGSTFYVNCNPASTHYNHIMVTICDNHGRQGFDILYKNIAHMLEDINKWIVDTPSVYSNEGLKKLYKNTSELEFNPNIDIPFDKNLENKNPKYARIIEKEYLDSETKWRCTDAVKYSIIKKGEVLTNRIVIKNINIKKTISPDALEKEIARITDLRIVHIRNRQLFADKNMDDEIFYIDEEYADLDVLEIPNQAQKNIDKILNTPLIDKYSFEQIRARFVLTKMYKHDCFRSFSIWYRIKYALGFYWG